jgi:hypothetical protein
MKILQRTFLIAFAMAITGCSNAISTNNASLTPTQVETTLLAAESNTPVHTDTPTNTPLPSSTNTRPPYFGYEQNCITVEDTIPSGFLSEGSIILTIQDGAGNDQLFALDTVENKLRLLSEERGYIINISPDGKWLAWDIDKDFNNQTATALEVLSANGQVLSTIPYNEGDWGSGPLYWMENSWVAFDLHQISQTFVNVFTGQIVQRDYSSRELSIYNMTFPFYAAGLTRAVFQRDILGQYVSMVLRDMESGKDLWKAEIGSGLWIIRPQWTPDSSRFVVGIPQDVYAPFFQFQLFIVDRDGGATQVTHITKPENEIFQTIWSPDERYVAFWLLVDSVGSLAVYDSKTGQVTDFCLTPYDPYGTQMFWSPDSRQIVFNIDNGLLSSWGPIVVVDVQENRAVKLIDKNPVMGWMTLLP